MKCIKIEAHRAAHKHYEYTTHAYALREEDGTRETCLNMLVDKLLS
jgi:hypothetical protein